jgi:hypothetical protein
MSFDFPFVRLFGVRYIVITLIYSPGFVVEAVLLIFLVFCVLWHGLLDILITEIYSS